LGDLKKSQDIEWTTVPKSKQIAKIRKILKNRTNFIEKKVDKEIQDIKNLLK